MTENIKSNFIKNEYPPFLIDQAIKKYRDYKLSGNQNQLKDKSDVHYFNLPYTHTHIYIYIYISSIWVLLHEHSWIRRLQGKGMGIPLTPHYHFHPLHRHLDISWAITAESSPLHIATSQTRTENLWFPRASC